MAPEEQGAPGDDRQRPRSRRRSRTAQVAGLLVSLALVLAVGTALVAAREDPQGGETHASSGAAPTETAPTPTETAPARGNGVDQADESRPAFLVPNMRSLAAHDLRIETTATGRLLRFSASLANVGAGPLLLLPLDTPGCGAGRHPAVQVLHFDRDRDGVFHRTRDRRGPQNRVGCMLRHAEHDHWHFNAMARYALRDPADDRELSARRKVSFCLRDNRQVDGQPVTVRKEYYGECSRDSRQGISPGWVDIYEWDLAGQTLELPAGVEGRLLCLDLEADPRNVLEETDETDNATSVAVRIRGDDVIRSRSQRCA